MAYCPAPKQAVNTVSPRRRLSSRSRGSAMVEFILVTAFIIIPVFFGIIVIGLSVILANQVTEVCRDTGHMFAYSVDFSQAASQLLVTNQLAQGLNMTPTGGRGVIYLSTITYVDSAACSAAGLAANSTNCPNLNQVVVIKRLTIGNTGVQPGTFAPYITQSIINSTGIIGAANYLTDTSVRANNFSNLITLTAGQYAYVSEMFVNPPIGGLWTLFSSNVITARSVF